MKFTETIFEPDYNHLQCVLNNTRPKRLPLYEHHIDPPFISKMINEPMEIDGLTNNELDDYFSKYIGFWKTMTYDGFDYEAAICEIFPGHGAIYGGMLGPIQVREDFDKYPWDELPKLFWDKYTPRLEAIRRNMPAGMKAYGGCGYGIFESAQDLVGYESLCLMPYLDPELFADLFQRIGDLYVTLWTEMVSRYSDIFVFFRMGDDLGFQTSTLMEPDTIRQYILPQYKRVIDVVHNGGKKFLLHSCGNIFSVMDDIIELGIDAKHSNEDKIAPYEKWIKDYNSRIGLFGGFDMNVLITESPDYVFEKVYTEGKKFRQMAKGYGLGSGNSIPDYMSVDGFLAMVEAVKKIRSEER